MELLTYTFIQYAFIGGFLMAVLAGLLGPFVVHSRQSFASDMFAHVALSGIGAALLVGIGPWWGALPALLIVSTLLWWLEQKQQHSPDALAILFLSGGLALALALVHIARDQVFSFENYLFGSILTLQTHDLIIMAIASIFTIIVMYILWYPLIGATQTPQYSIPFNNKPALVRLLFFWILAVVVWIGIKTVGGLLIGAMLVIPTLVVRGWVQSFNALTQWSIVVTVFGTTTGLLLSVFLDLPPSSLIIGTLISCFIIQLTISHMKRP